MRDFPKVHEIGPYLATARFEAIPNEKGEYFIKRKPLFSAAYNGGVNAADRTEAIAIMETLELTASEEAFR